MLLPVKTEMSEIESAPAVLAFPPHNMSCMDHNVYLNAYLSCLVMRTRPCNRKMRCVDCRYPVVGGLADVSPRDIAERARSGDPMSPARVEKGDVVCHHGWKAQGPAIHGQYFCVGWVRQDDCKTGRNPKSDGLDCGFRLDLAGVQSSARVS